MLDCKARSKLASGRRYLLRRCVAKSSTWIVADAVQILNLVEYIPWSQFTSAVPSATGTNYTATAAFDISGKAGKKHAALPTASLEGSSYVIQHTALSDRRLTHGVCETHSWVNVDLVRDGAVIHQSQHLVKLDCKPQRLSITSSGGGKHNDVTVCRPSQSGLRSRWTSSRPSTQVEVRLPHEEPLRLDSVKRAQSSETHDTVEIPLEAAFSHLPASAIEAMSQSAGVRCDIETKWCTKRSFNTSPLSSNKTTARDQPEIKQQLVSTQSSEITFPPLLHLSDDSDDGEKASTIGMLHLVLPASASLPSLHTDLLKVKYELELRYTFRLDSGRQPLQLKGTAKIECCLSS